MPMPMPMPMGAAAPAVPIHLLIRLRLPIHLLVDTLTLKSQNNTYDVLDKKTHLCEEHSPVTNLSPVSNDLAHAAQFHDGKPSKRNQK